MLQEYVAIEIGAAVDKSRDLRHQQISAKANGIEDVTVEPGAARRFNRGCGHNVRARRETALVKQPSRCNQRNRHRRYCR